MADISGRHPWSDGLTLTFEWLEGIDRASPALRSVPRQHHNDDLGVYTPR